MIKTEEAYKNALQRLEKDREYLAAYRAQLTEQGLTTDEITRVMEPQMSFHQQLNDEVTWYEGARRGDPQAIGSLRDLGRLLIALRIASGMSQRELATKLSVHESQISRDERNEYYGISMDRAQEIIEALNANLAITAQPRDIMVRDLLPP